MTKLLVSVRSAEEAADAVAGGADLIDVKEPSAGSLGAATPEVVAAVMKTVAGRRPTSIALGELDKGIAEWQSFADLLPPNRLPQFVKFGLAGCSTRPGLAGRWKAALATLPDSVSPVAVLYADWSVAGSPTEESGIAIRPAVALPRAVGRHIRQAWTGIVGLVDRCRAGTVRRGGARRRLAGRARRAGNGRSKSTGCCRIRPISSPFAEPFAAAIDRGDWIPSLSSG